jgi:hypothetical protein
MLVSVQHVVDRWRHPRSRADELLTLRRRFATATRKATPGERALAAELRALRLELAALIGTLSSCAGCARGCALPGGRWDGGHCCSGETAQLFADDEVAALALAGTTTRDLVPPRGDHAGCAFRGSAGCTLAAADRPNLCVVYLCREATRELHARGVLDEVERLTASVSERYRALVGARAERQLAAELEGQG